MERDKHMKKMFFIFTLFFVLILTSACGTKTNNNISPESGSGEVASVSEVVVIEDGRYVVSPEQSTLVWKANKVLAGHTGLVTIKSGELAVSGGQLTASDIVMDMSTITSDEGIDSLVKHLKSPDFFNVEEYPEARLAIKSSVAGNEPGEYIVNADLTIKGITNPVEFLAKSNLEEGRLLSKAEIIIDRTKWDINYRSGKFFQDLGDNLISDEISFVVDLSASKTE